jgi:hypothetical protein
MAIIAIAMLQVSCSKEEKNTETPIGTLRDTIGVGYRWSPYGIGSDPGTEYYAEIGTRLSSYFGKGVKPMAIWILGTLQEQGACKLNFPASPKGKLIYTSSTDYNEEKLNRFDELGYKVWLQVESGFADVNELIQLVLERYSHHECIYGFGVDVEWYNSISEGDDMGQAVTDSAATLWLNTIHSFNPEYKLFLKHWLTEKMPPTVRKDIEFIDDSQYFDNLGQMVNEFKDWANYFAPSKVGFQYGYDGDKHWWSAYDNPVLTIGEEILSKTTNTTGLFWVDFTLKETYPPKTK